jgi:phosphonopyruvate decarboxylase
VRAIAAARRDSLVVLTMSGLGLWPDPREEDFRLVGLMGAAASIGLGIALGAPDRGVWVIDGDGSLLMQLGVLSAIADAAPPNFTHIVLANAIYAISGAQPVPGDVDWPQLALGAGYREAIVCRAVPEISAALGREAPGPRMVVVACDRTRPVYAPGVFNVDPALEAPRVRAALAAPAGLIIGPPRT